MLNSTLFEKAQLRHAIYYLDRLKQATSSFNEDMHTQAFRQFESDWLQIQKAHQWAIDSSQKVDVMRLIVSFPMYGNELLEIRQTVTERIRWLSVGIDAAEKLNDKRAVMQHNLQLSRCYLTISENQMGIEKAQLTLDISLEIGNPLYESRALTLMSNHLTRLGRFEEARDYCLRSVEISEAHDDKRGLGMSYGNLGSLATLQGDYDAGENYQRLSLAVNREIGNVQGITKSLNNLGSVQWHRGNLKQAREFYTQCLQIRQEINDQLGIADVLNNLGAVSALSGDFEGAKAYWTQCLEISERNQIRRLLATSLINLANVYKDLKDYTQALRYFHEAEVLTREIKMRYPLLNARLGIGFIYIALNQPEEAVPYLLGVLTESREMSSMAMMFWAVVGIAHVYFLRGDVERAAEIVGMVKVHKVANDVNLKRDLETLLTLVSETLSPSSLDATLEQGRFCDPDTVISQILTES